MADMKMMVGHILEIGEYGSDVAFESGLDSQLRNTLCLPVGQLVAFERSLAKGLNSDKPYDLGSVVKL